MNLREKYRNILIGFEAFSYDESVLKCYEGDLNTVLDDQSACANCDGEICKTSLNHKCRNPYWHLYRDEEPCDDECYTNDFRGYFGLYKKACTKENPGFAVFECPGVSVRKKQLLEKLQSNRDENEVPHYWDR